MTLSPKEIAAIREKYVHDHAIPSEIRMLLDEVERLSGVNGELVEAIAEFCSESAWASESWKAQPHIKTLFDIDKART